MSGLTWNPAYVGLGSNLDGPEGQVERGFYALMDLPETRLVAQSPRYRSTPMGVVDQPDFVNAVAGLLTRLSPHELLDALKALEVRLGREQPVRRWGPRVIDFDLLVYSEQVVADPVLTLPHPGLLERNWVLYPLRDIAPSLVIPGHGQVATLTERLGRDGLELLPSTAATPCRP